MDFLHLSGSVFAGLHPLPDPFAFHQDQHSRRPCPGAPLL